MPLMKPCCVLFAILVAPTSAWIGRPFSELPRLHRSNHPALPTIPTKDSSINNIMKKPMNIRGGASLEMSLANNPLVTSLVPKIGVITSTLLYFSPMAAVRTASKDDTLGDLNPIPLAIMAVSSLCWLAYGLSIRDPYVTLSNVPGCIAAIWYITAVLPLLKGSQLQTTQNIVVFLSAVTINLWTYLSLTNKAIGQVRSALGSYATALFIVLSGSPLSTIKTVLSTRDSSTILTPFTLAQVTNCGIWSAYGLAIKDKFVYGPNLTGLSFGLIQLVLKILFPAK